MQLFTRSPRGFAARPLDDDDVRKFRQDVKESGIEPVFVHAPYLPNLAATDRKRSRMTAEILVSDAERCRRLGVRFLIVHAGRATGATEERALRGVSDSIDRVLDKAPESVMLLLENTAGMGSEVGYRFEQLREIIDRVGDRDRLGVVLDTAHLFEAGYELATRPGLDETLRQFDRQVGMGRLYLLHLNDSRTGFGSRKDRHWHIGKGEIGLAGFREIVNHPLLAHLPGIMETPRKTLREDRSNMATVRSLVR